MSFWLPVCVTGWLFVRPVYLKERKPFLKTTAYWRVSKRLSDNSMVSWICWKDRSKWFFFQLSFFTCLEEIFVRRSGAAQFLNSNCYGKRNITLDVEFTGSFIRGDYSKFELIEVESAKLYNNWVISIINWVDIVNNIDNNCMFVYDPLFYFLFLQVQWSGACSWREQQLTWAWQWPFTNNRRVLWYCKMTIGLEFHFKLAHVK